MKEVFNIIFQTSLYATVVGCVILIFKILIKNKVNPKWQYLLWMVLILKLVIPFGPESGFSLFNAVPSKVQSVASNPSYAVNQIISSKAINTVKTDKIDKSSEGTFENTMPFIWATGAIGLALWFLFTLILFYNRLFRNAYIPKEELQNIFDDCKMEMHVHKKIKLVIQNDINKPALIGVIRPTVLITEEALGYEEDIVRYIFLHELSHYKRRDIFMNYMLIVLQCLHWFNPVIWYCFRKIREDMEFAADERALKLIDAKEYKAYGGALLRVLEDMPNKKLTPKLICLVDTKKNVEKRINLIKKALKSNGKGKMVSLIGLCCLVLLSVVLLTTETKKTYKITETYHTKNLLEYKTQYIGNNSKVLGILSNLQQAQYRGKISLQTEKTPYGLTVAYDLKNPLSEIDELYFNNNAVLLFALIDNLDNIIFQVNFSGEQRNLTYSRTEIQKNYQKDLREYSMDKEQLQSLVDSLSFRVLYYPKSYSPAMSSVPGVQLSSEKQFKEGTVTYTTNKGSFVSWNNASISKLGKAAELSYNTKIYWQPVENDKVIDIKEKVIVDIKFIDKNKKVLEEMQVEIKPDKDMYVVVPSSKTILDTK